MRTADVFRRSWLTLLIVVSTLSLWSTDNLAQPSAGPLVVVGGGPTVAAITARTLELAGGTAARVVVLPQSSALPDAGDTSVKMWLDAGASDARKVLFGDVAAARAAIEQATLIWMPGGDQNRFMDAIAPTGLADVIRARHRAGVVVGGTSAGAAILSASMMTGEADLRSLASGSTELKPGLGLWPEVIVDQHFLKRQRHNRLLSAILDHPSLIGVGIDESTAVIVRGRDLEVVGVSAVVVLDARNGRVTPASAGQPVAATDARVTVLRAGLRYTLP
ncbi:MAG: cyanophycinase [Acidobacteria bacterium]|nr:cyanophycinase [Acidobacteriota bacterium]